MLLLFKNLPLSVGEEEPAHWKYTSVGWYGEGRK